jgi:DNA-binding SARP family transcriptional activator
MLPVLLRRVSQPVPAGMSTALASEVYDERVGARPTEAARADLAGLHLTLLNGFELQCDGDLVPLPAPAQRLIAFLALEDRPVLRTHVAGTLWLESTTNHAFGSLRSALWRVRRSGHELIEATTSQLRLSPSVAVDVREARTWARRVLEGSAEPRIKAYRGDLLPDWYDDWVLFERERLRELRVRALEHVCADFTAAGMFYQAVEAALAAVLAEPLRESAHRCLITVHLAEGNKAEAIRHYRLYRGLLRDQLGLEPSNQMEDLVKDLGHR